MSFLLALLLVVASQALGSPPDLRIVGGDGAVQGQFPYQVSVRRYVLWSWRHRCGGTLISKNWVLTTASCTHDAWFLRVAAGKNDLRVVEDGEQIAGVSKTIVHANFTPSAAESWEFDIALLRVSKPFEYTSNVKPARLPLDEFGSGAPLIVTGWGVVNPGGWFGWGRRWADTLQVLVVETQPCRGARGSVGLCVLSNSGGTPCQGDEGGAMVQMLRDNTFTIVGMVTRNPDDCKSPQEPSAAVRVFDHLKFIEDTMVTK